jgi:hypothetical protein
VVRTFQSFNQFFDVIEIKSRRRTQIPRLDHEGFSRRWLRSRQPQSQKPIHHLLKWLAGLAGLLLEQVGYIII